MLVSPTEPLALRRSGTVSSIPENYGSDVLIAAPGIGKVGVQRKEIRDLVSSANNGMLSKEFGKMKSLDLGVLLIEGRVAWTTGGLLATNSRLQWTKAQHQGILWSVQSQGFWVLSTYDLDDTINSLLLFEKWLGKERHSSLNTRPKAKGEWGRADNREWGIHLLQSFPGIGSVNAGAIYDEFGSVPLKWIVSELDLQAVKGVGAGRAEKLYRSLNSREETSP